MESKQYNTHQSLEILNFLPIESADGYANWKLMIVYLSKLVGNEIR